MSASPIVAFESKPPWCIGHCTIASLADMQHLDEFEAEFARCLDQQRPRFLAIDLSGVTYVVTRVLSALLVLHKRQRESGNYMAVCGLDPNVARVLRLTRLDRVFDIYPDLSVLLSQRPDGRPPAVPAPGFGP